MIVTGFSEGDRAWELELGFITAVPRFANAQCIRFWPGSKIDFLACVTYPGRTGLEGKSSVHPKILAQTEAWDVRADRFPRGFLRGNFAAKEGCVLCLLASPACDSQKPRLPGFAVKPINQARKRINTGHIRTARCGE
jgi:hypothetical protein